MSISLSLSLSIHQSTIHITCFLLIFLQCIPQAQYEIDGAQYFLGIFDSEEAAWTAYENHSRSSHQIASLVPPLPDSYEDILQLLQPSENASAPSVVNITGTTTGGAKQKSSGKSTKNTKQGMLFNRSLVKPLMAFCYLR